MPFTPNINLPLIYLFPASSLLWISESLHTNQDSKNLIMRGQLICTECAIVTIKRGEECLSRPFIQFISDWQSVKWSQCICMFQRA